MFLSRIIFLVISITGIRTMIINAIPAQLKLAIGAGIGFFIAFIGLKMQVLLSQMNQHLLVLVTYKNQQLF